MRHPQRLLLFLLAATLAGCTGGTAGVGEACFRHSDCDATLQCAARVCAPRCARAADCGDGFGCDADGVCQRAVGQAGDRCRSEAACAAGLACQIDGFDDDQRLVASCAAQLPGGPASAACRVDRDCRNGTCALGHCVDLCATTRDCAAGTSCTAIPRVEAGGAMFDGCLPSRGVVSWPIPLRSSDEEILFPVPAGAHHAELVLTAPAPQQVGAKRVIDPAGRLVYRPCSQLNTALCDEPSIRAQFYQNPIRHRWEAGTSVLAIPTSTMTPLIPGAYRVSALAIQPGGAPGATPAVTAAVRMGPAVLLDLHFFFLDLADHPCAAAFDNTRLAAATASAAAFFQDDYLGPVIQPPVAPGEKPRMSVRSIFTNAGVALGEITYEDLREGVDGLDALEIADADRLLRLGHHDRGVNVFFVRSLSPVGLQAFGPNPGPGGLGGTGRSGIVIGADTLCYRSWSQLARLTAYELARYMGLYRNIEIGATVTDDWRDPIPDSDDEPDNLMFYSELGGSALSPGQRDILLRSPVLR